MRMFNAMSANAARRHVRRHADTAGFGAKQRDAAHIKTPSDRQIAISSDTNDQMGPRTAVCKKPA